MDSCDPAASGGVAAPATIPPMIVPTYWAEARAEAVTPEGRRVRVARFGWSDASEADARRVADVRAREAAQAVECGRAAARREPKVPYNGAEGVPIREEVVRRVGEAVLTRNSYGAICLNTPDVLFADVDFDAPRSPLVSCLASLAGGVALAVVGGRQSGFGGVVLGLMLGSLVAALVTDAVRRGWSTVRGGPERVAERRIARLAKSHPHGRFEVYRTPAGLRVLATHEVFDPAGDAARALFAAVGADKRYVAMCRRQKCFRARLTAKPWRIGIQGHLRPRPGVWPVSPERRPERAAWLAAYDAAAAGYAACRHERTLGLGPEHARVAAVRKLHDELCRSHSGLPLA